jgi:hypothetical protein
MPTKYKPSSVSKSRLKRAPTQHYYMHMLDNTQLWNEFFTTNNKRYKHKMRNELYSRGFRHEDFVQRSADR